MTNSDQPPFAKSTPSSGSSPPRVLDRPTAWACLATNLLVLPGLGSVTVGRRIGYAQMAVSLLGALLTLVFLYQVVVQLSQSELDVEHLWPVLKTGLLGAGLFLAGWIWSLITSILMVRQTPPQ